MANNQLFMRNGQWVNAGTLQRQQAEAEAKAKKAGKKSTAVDAVEPVAEPVETPEGDKPSVVQRVKAKATSMLRGKGKK